MFISQQIKQDKSDSVAADKASVHCKKLSKRFTSRIGKLEDS